MPGDLVVLAKSQGPRLTFLLELEVMTDVFEVEASVTLVLQRNSNVNTKEKY